MKLILFRHGQTQENVDGVVQGWLHTKLNTAGIKQAKQAAKSFDEKIDVIYSSDLKRCVQTAREFRKKYPDIPYFEDERLRERCFGDAQGTDVDLYDWRVFWSAKDSVSITNAETLNDYSQRVKDFVESLKNQLSSSSKILVITHGGTINRILDVYDIEKQYLPVENLGVVRVELN